MKLISVLQYHKHFTIDQVENMIPFERDFYTEMLLEHLEKEKKAKNAQ